jgi:predicted anti-sigma-YlaC factor YlaD
VTEHIEKSRMEGFCAKTLPESEMKETARHLADCPHCHGEFVEGLQHQRSSLGVGFTLAPEFWFRHDHIDFDQLVSLADNKLDGTQREIIDIHLKACETCREDVRSFLAFREKTAPAMDVSYASVRREPSRERSSRTSWWRALPLKSTYAIAAVVLVVVAIVVTAMILRRRAETLEAKKDQPAQINILPSPTPANVNAASQPSPSTPEQPKAPGTTPSPTVLDTGAVAVLKDGPRQITVDRSGRLTGLDELPPTTQREIADAAVAEGIERPDVLNKLTGENSGLRGSNSGQSFKLLSPGRTVVIGDQPVFKWEKLPSAASYRVYVTDARGREVVRSDELSSERLEWATPKPLKRGEVYSWSVIAVVNGKEIVSPSSSSPEMKFQVLPVSNLQQIGQLKKTHSHLALGVFFAKAGLLKEAEQEFQKLVQLNPQSELARKLLRNVRSLRESKHH